jgi:hypothetical protein
LSDETEGFKIFHNVGLFVGDEKDVKLLERLIQISHVFRLDKSVLAAGRDQLGEGGEQTLDPKLAHDHELAGDEDWER